MKETPFINRDGSPNVAMSNEAGSVRVQGLEYHGQRKRTRLHAVHGERRIYKDEFIIISTLSRKKLKRYAGQFLASMGCSSGLAFR